MMPRRLMRSDRRLHPDVEALADDLGGVDLAAVAAHLEMQVRAGRIAGRADQADALARRHRFARVDVDAAEVSVQAGHAVGMLHLDKVAVAPRIIAGAQNLAL